MRVFAGRTVILLVYHVAAHFFFVKVVKMKENIKPAEKLVLQSKTNRNHINFKENINIQNEEEMYIFANYLNVF